MTAEWEAVLPEVIIKGVTGSFNDRIKLNYYLDIPEEVMADESAYVLITNESTGNSDGKLFVRDARYNREKGGYRFSVELPAKEAGDTITASVLTYARSCAVQKGTSEDIENTRNLGKALYLYNRAAVAAFGD